MSFFSNFVIALKFAKELMFNYKEATKEEAATKESLYYLFLILLIPSALTTIFLYFTRPVDQNLFFPIIGFLPYPFVFLPIFFILTVVFAMVGLALLAGLTHILAKALRLIQGNYSNTLAAIVYGATPGIFISILSAPLSYFFGNLANGAIGIATFVFGVTVGVTALENQHKIGGGRALFVYFLPVIIIVITAGVLISVVGLSVFSNFGLATIQNQEQISPREEFLERTSTQFEILDAVCVPDSEYVVVIKNLDPENSIDVGDLSASVDNINAFSRSWFPPNIPSGGTSTLTIRDPAGGEAGTGHRIKITASNGFVQEITIFC